MQQIIFASFAPSPHSSPHSSPQKQPNVHKISIHLPDSLTESTVHQPFDHQSPQNTHPQPNHQQQDNIKVYCRFRTAKTPCSIKYDQTMIDDGENRYTFDVVLGKFATQYQVYQQVAERHISAFFEGLNSTIFTYGQTGSGKTFTMFGNLKEPNEYGIIPRTLQEVFKRKKSQDTITCSILEIYNEKLNDLFDPLKRSEGVKLKEINENVVLQGLVEVTVESQQEVMELIRFGYRDRKIAATYNNDASSRSHTILFLYRNYTCQDKPHRNKLCFIDLAGSQKIRKSGVKGQTLEETKKINLSLSCLGNVVFALTNSAQHIPYRNSKLTRILKDSLCGTCKTSIITTCSLERSDFNETISTIKFAVRAKKIKNKKRLSNAQFTMEEVIENLKKELTSTKKELEYYKRKQQMQEESRWSEDIPQEEVSCKTVKFSCLNGGVGASSRIKMISTTYTE